MSALGQEREIRLVVTPKPDRRESAIGYTLRLTERNGYTSPSLFLPTKTTGQLPRRGPSAQRLMRVAGLDADSAARLELARHRQRAILFGHTLMTRNVRLEHHAICPDCVARDGIFDASWHLAQINFCPTHRTLLVSECDTCHSSLKMGRSGVGICRCRAIVRPHPDGLQCTDAGADLLNHLRSRLIGDAELAPAVDGFAILDRLDLSSSLDLVGAAYRHAHFSGDPTGKMVQVEKLDRTARALRAWTDGVAAFWAILDHRDPDDFQYATRDSFGWLMGGTYRMATAPALAFMREAICEAIPSNRALYAAARRVEAEEQAVTKAKAKAEALLRHAEARQVEAERRSREQLHNRALSAAARHAKAEAKAADKAAAKAEALLRRAEARQLDVKRSTADQLRVCSTQGINPQALQPHKHLPRSLKPEKPLAWEAEWIKVHAAAQITGCGEDQLIAAAEARFLVDEYRGQHGITLRKREVFKLKPSDHPGMDLETAAHALGVSKWFLARLRKMEQFALEYVPCEGGLYSTEDVGRISSFLSQAQGYLLCEKPYLTLETFLSLPDCKQRDMTPAFLNAMKNPFGWTSLKIDSSAGSPPPHPKCGGSMPVPSPLLKGNAVERPDRSALGS